MQPRAGDSVLDLACGTGVVARLAARFVDRGQVTGLDLSSGMLAVARSVAHEGAAISWVQGSALDLPLSARASMSFCLNLDCNSFLISRKRCVRYTGSYVRMGVLRSAFSARSSAHPAPMPLCARSRSSSEPMPR